MKQQHNTTPRRTSLRAAINVNCRDCIYDPLAGGTWLQQVVDCTCTACPLYPVRPKRKPSANRALKSEHSRELRHESDEHAAGNSTPRVQP